MMRTVQYTVTKDEVVTLISNYLRVNGYPIPDNAIFMQHDKNGRENQLHFESITITISEEII